MDFIAGIFELIASAVIGKKHRVGFLIGLLSCIIWSYVAVTQQVYGLLIVTIPAMGIGLWNYRKWGIDPPYKAPLPSEADTRPEQNADPAHPADILNLTIDPNRILSKVSAALKHAQPYTIDGRRWVVYTSLEMDPPFKSLLFQQCTHTEEQALLIQSALSDVLKSENLEIRLSPKGLENMHATLK